MNNGNDNYTLRLFIVEDNPKLLQGLQTGLVATGDIALVGTAANSEQAIDGVLSQQPQVVLMDVELRDSELNGVQTAVALRREIPRLPVVFYSIADDDRFYRDFLNSGILSHYAYVRKGNYLLPQMVVPLLRDAISGRSFIAPDIEARVQAVRLKDEEDPMALLEPNERAVIALLAQGQTNRQIAEQLGLRDARAISRTNGQIYTAWGLNQTTTDEKVARTRASLIFNQQRMIIWDEQGQALVMTPTGKWVSLEDEE